MTSIIGGSQEVNTFDQALPTLSDKYKLVKTKDLIDSLIVRGFKMTAFVANKTRKAERQGFQKHRAIFTSDKLKSEHSDGIPQLLLTNSHDGTSAVVLQLGFFRMVCANGLVAGNNVGLPIRIKHVGKNIYEELEKGVDLIVAQLARLDADIKAMKATELSPSQVQAFQRDSLILRIDANEKVLSSTFVVHRQEDKPTDLFTVMNVIQENLIRGGARFIVEKDGQPKQKTLRKVNSIQTQTDINQGLWGFAMQLVA